MTRLTWPIVYAIRDTDPARQIKDVATEFGIAPSNCYNILAGKIWKDRSYTPAVRTSHRTKLTWAIVREIRAQAAAGAKQISLAAQYGVTPACVNVIVKNRTWRDPSYTLAPPAPRGRKLSQEQVAEIRHHYADDRSCSWIASRYGVSAVTIWNVVNRRSWAEAAE